MWLEGKRKHARVVKSNTDVVVIVVELTLLSPNNHVTNHVHEPRFISTCNLH